MPVVWSARRTALTYIDVDMWFPVPFLNRKSAAIPCALYIRHNVHIGYSPKFLHSQQQLGKLYQGKVVSWFHEEIHVASDLSTTLWNVQKYTCTNWTFLFRESVFYFNWCRCVDGAEAIVLKINLTAIVLLLKINIYYVHNIPVRLHNGH